MYNDSDYITESTSDTETDTELEATTDAKTEVEHSEEEEQSNTDSDDGCDSKIHPMDHHSKTASASAVASATKHKIILFDISEEEFHDLQETIYSLCDEFLKSDGLTMCLSGFKDKMTKYVSDIILDDLIESEIFTYNHYEDIIEICKDGVDIYFDSMQIPEFVAGPHRITLLDNSQTSITTSQIRSQIDFLRVQPQPAQKSEEWYRERHSLITASNIWKALGSQAQQNSLITEKCKPFVLQPYQQGLGYCNTASPMHWGNKYEPLTRMIYEAKYETVVEDFGCIKHPKFPFIGASPDGINVEPASPRYGRMLEIKNIVNRDITGIPSDKYWIQVQVQLETCDLNVCDFVETRFKEYTHDEFYQDIGENSAGVSAGAGAGAAPGNEYRGVILYFTDTNNQMPIYEYMPLWVKLDPETIQNWMNEQVATHMDQGHTLFDTLYWYLHEFSCVVIERNRKWFDLAVEKLAAIKQTIDKETVSGFQHRVSLKNTKQSICLIKLDGP
jgi:putative phage-type endonuclease